MPWHPPPPPPQKKKKKKVKLLKKKNLIYMYIYIQCLFSHQIND